MTRAATISCLILSATVSGVATASLPSRYYLTDLSAAPTYSKVSINSMGQVATTLAGKPSLWTPARRNGVEPGTWTTLPTPLLPPGPFNPNPTIANAVALDLNDFGQVCGNLGTSDWGGKAYLWTPSAPNTSTGSYALVTTSTAAAYGMNNYGQLGLFMGQSPYPSSVWTPTIPNTEVGNATTLQRGGGAFAINARGDVALRSSSESNVFRPYTPQGTVGEYAAIGEVISAINDAGWLATLGGVYTPSFSPVLSYSKLASSPLHCVAINNSNVALVSSGSVWTMNEGQVSISSRLETHSSTGWTLVTMRDLNDVGQIVGTAIFDPDNNPSTSNSITRTVLLTPLIAGDANIDQQVNFDDLLKLAQHYGQVGVDSWTEGDFDGNGLADFDDLLALAQNYGVGAPHLGLEHFSEDWAHARSMVPEPALGMILGCGLVRRGRRRSDPAPVLSST